ncbi:MAG TPA: tyrosine-protein phosphatase [Polyangiaceae bacterium]|nr:tyrosine-protein phosphatase [Polyangiaceae bacterium]
MSNSLLFSAALVAAACGLTSCGSPPLVTWTEGGNGSTAPGECATNPHPECVKPGETPNGPPDVVCKAGRPILTPEIVNARDLGGTPIVARPAEEAAEGAAEPQSVACGAVFRGPPLVLSSAACGAFAELGIRTVIDLRVESERVAKPDSECVGATASIQLSPLPVPYNVSTQDYIADLNTTESIAAVFHTLGSPDAYPVYLHCTWGRDRTGIVAALVLLALGVAREDVMAEYSLSLPLVGAYPDSLAGMLDELEARGGIGAYLAGIGISDDELAVLREHALPPL